MNRQYLSASPEKLLSRLENEMNIESAILHLLQQDLPDVNSSELQESLKITQQMIGRISSQLVVRL